MPVPPGASKTQPPSPPAGVVQPAIGWKTFSCGHVAEGETHSTPFVYGRQRPHVPVTEYDPATAGEAKTPAAASANAPVSAIHLASCLITSPPFSLPSLPIG